MSKYMQRKVENPPQSTAQMQEREENSHQMKMQLSFEFYLTYCLLFKFNSEIWNVQFKATISYPNVGETVITTWG